jgi:uncharacterized protein (DUF885 family)
LLQILKKRILAGCLALTVLTVSCSGCRTPSHLFSSVKLPKEQRSFDNYTEKLFTEELRQNTIHLHYTLADPKKFGIDSHKISLGSLSKKDWETSASSAENISAALDGFQYEALDTKQQLTHDILKDYCEQTLSSSDFYYYEEPLRPTTGIQSELPILLAEYAFQDPRDVTDYLALLTCIEDYFSQIARFEEEKSKEGLFMSDYAADAVIKACRTFTEHPKENYLIDTFQTRIDSMKNLSEEKKKLYKDQNRSLVEHAVIPSYQKLADTLKRLKGSGANDAGLCRFPKGKPYYESLVRHSTGSEKSIKQLQEMTKRQRSLDLAALQKLLAEHPNLAASKEPELIQKEPKEMLDHLLQAIQKDFYPAADSSYQLNYVHKSLEGTLAPAFYLTAPIDDISRNVIYLNKGSQYSGIQLFTTLAHEGFPGHLYQTTGSAQAGLAPIRALLNYPGYVEGWATYVEMLSYQYAGLTEDMAELLMRNQSALLSLYASIDMGIHYDGWNLADTIVFLKNFGITNRSTIQSMYELIVEEPSHYLKYYIGYLEFLELKEYAKDMLGSAYSDRNFHQAVIRIGPAPFKIVKNYFKDFYIQENP